MDEVEWTFLADKKKIKANNWPGEKPPSRIMKDLIKEAKFVKAPDRVLFVGCTSRPYLCEKGDGKKLNAFFKDCKIGLPLPDYASMQVIWRHLITKHGGVVTDALDLQALSWVTRTSSYTAGQVNVAVKKVLTQRRLQRMLGKPLTHFEFVPHLARQKPFDRDDFVTLMKWVEKNDPQGKKEEKPKTAASDKKKGKGAKKKK
mmetsp:Transcript_36150/g.95059  ORF Transcript_36150/g.95059 Transcript_36150/m.95059 type:complete len:202 (+) Transcript_36150:920-1525(+)